MSFALLKPLLFNAPLSQYEEQADSFFNAYKSGDPDVIQWLKDRPHFWIKDYSDVVNRGDHQISTDSFKLAHAQSIIARWYAFKDWPTLAEYAKAASTENSHVWQFESAIDAIIAGDTQTLQSLLSANHDLIRARSMRVHQATLLIYVGANGVEGYRQKTPKNAVEIAKILLDAGAEIDAIGTMYGGSSTLGLVATSVHPYVTGVQNDLIDILLDRGAQFEVAVAKNYTEGIAVCACLANGRPEAAEHLAKRGAPLNFEGAAGVGRLDIVKSYFNEDGTPKPHLTKEQMEKGFIAACNCGRIDVADFLLNRGVNIAASNGQSGLHLAAHAGKLEMVKFLLDHNAPLELVNEYGGTVLGQALWSAYNDPRPNHLAIVETLLNAGAEAGEDQKWIDELRRRNAPKE
jgi:hypothetical protein